MQLWHKYHKPVLCASVCVCVRQYLGLNSTTLEFPPALPPVQDGYHMPAIHTQANTHTHTQLNEYHNPASIKVCNTEANLTYKRTEIHNEVKTILKTHTHLQMLSHIPLGMQVIPHMDCVGVHLCLWSYMCLLIKRTVKALTHYTEHNVPLMQKKKVHSCPSTPQSTDVVLIRQFCFAMDTPLCSPKLFQFNQIKQTLKAHIMHEGVGVNINHQNRNPTHFITILFFNLNKYLEAYDSPPLLFQIYFENNCVSACIFP